MKILIVEDNDNLRDLISQFFIKYKYVVDSVEDGRKALESILTNEYNCILLDLNLPVMDGLEVARKVRARNIETPIIMLTARSQIYNKLEGLDLGADDYITKPFDMNEVLARVRSVIRRSSLNKESVLQFNGLLVYPEKNKVVNEDAQEIFLSNKEMGILEYVLRNEGRIVSTEELLEHVWDREADIFSDTVKTHIKTLRQKVDKGKKYIKTVRGKGYIYES